MVLSCRLSGMIVGLGLFRFFPRLVELVVGIVGPVLGAVACRPAFDVFVDAVPSCPLVVVVVVEVPVGMGVGEGNAES